MTTNNQTILVLANGTVDDVQVWITLGATPGCIQHVSDLPFVTTIVNDLQGYFTLKPAQPVFYTPPAGKGLNGNVSFGTPPLNCPTTDWPKGVNVAEFILNNSFQTGNPQETIDISAVAGVNAYIKFIMFEGGAWNYGQTDEAGHLKTVTEFENKGLGDNVGQVGVFPYGCDVCTSSAAPPVCPGPPTPPPHGACQSAAICNVQRPASTAGGRVLIRFDGWSKYPRG